MARMGIPFAVLFNAATCVLNLAIGVSHLLHHHKIAACVSLSCAALSAATAIWVWKRNKDLARLRREELEDQMALSPAAERQGIENLQKVCKLFGATPYGGFVQVVIQGQIFRLTRNGIYKINDAGEEIHATCYQIASMPAEEKIASALLLLHNDPTVFDRWCRQDGSYV